MSSSKEKSSSSSASNNHKRVSFNQQTTIREFSKDMPASIVNQTVTSTRNIKHPPKRSTLRHRSVPQVTFNQQYGPQFASQLYYSNIAFQPVHPFSMFNFPQQQNMQWNIQQGFSQNQPIQYQRTGGNSSSYSCPLPYSFNPYYNPYNYYNYLNTFSQYPMQPQNTNQFNIQSGNPKQMKANNPFIEDVFMTPQDKYEFLGTDKGRKSNTQQNEEEDNDNTSEDSDEEHPEIAWMDESSLERVRKVMKGGSSDFDMHIGKEIIVASDESKSSEVSSVNGDANKRKEKISPVTSPLSPSGLLNQDQELTAASYISLSSSSSSASSSSSSSSSFTAPAPSVGPGSLDSSDSSSSEEYFDASVPRAFYNAESTSSDGTRFKELFDYGVALTSLNKDEPTRKRRKL